MAKKSKDKSLKSWLTPHLRNIARMWPQKNIARARAAVRVEVGKFKNGKPEHRTMFKCCDCEELFHREDTHVDHREPVVGPEGFTNWDDYINRLFCDSTNLAVICVLCHQLKTNSEQEVRKENKKVKAK